jgi:MFS family permease
LNVSRIRHILIGLGFTFQTGAVDAWLVDALDFTGYDRPKERVFALGGMAFSAAMLVGTLVGGFLGQVDLSLPYLVRAGLLALTFVVTAILLFASGVSVWLGVEEPFARADQLHTGPYA